MTVRQCGGVGALCCYVVRLFGYSFVRSCVQKCRHSTPFRVVGTFVCPAVSQPPAAPDRARADNRRPACSQAAQSRHGKEGVTTPKGSLKGHGVTHRHVPACQSAGKVTGKCSGTLPLATGATTVSVTNKNRQPPAAGQSVGCGYSASLRSDDVTVTS